MLYDEPDCTSVVIENGEGGGSVAGPVAREVLEVLLKQLGHKKLFHFLLFNSHTYSWKFRMISVTSIDISYFLIPSYLNFFNIDCY